LRTNTKNYTILLSTEVAISIYKSRSIYLVKQIIKLKIISTIWQLDYFS
jgi:hypothetical protein